MRQNEGLYKNETFFSISRYDRIIHAWQTNGKQQKKTSHMESWKGKTAEKCSTGFIMGQNSHMKVVKEKTLVESGCK